MGAFPYCYCQITVSSYVACYRSRASTTRSAVGPRRSAHMMINQTCNAGGYAHEPGWQATERLLTASLDRSHWTRRASARVANARVAYAAMRVAYRYAESTLIVRQGRRKSH